jgi:Zn-finger nucleic acid-binding protein
MLEDYKTHPIICECCGEKIACPNCGNTDRLRGWGASGRTLALCYDCGAVFWADSGEILKFFEGNKDIWGAMGMALAFTLTTESGGE